MQVRRLVGLVVVSVVGACGGAIEPTDPLPAAPVGTAPSRRPPSDTPKVPEAAATSPKKDEPAAKGRGRPAPVSCPSSFGDCRSDSDCGGGAVCGCAVGAFGQNICLTQSRCKVDSDCGQEKCNLSKPFIFSPKALDGGVASFPDAGKAQYGGVYSGSDLGGFSFNEGLGYFCSTPDDTCVPGESSFPAGDCVFSPASNRWVVGSKP